MNKGLEAARKAPRKKRESMRKAIDDMCKQCIYDPYSGAGTWRQQVEGCTSPSCPLFNLRPKAEGSSHRESEENG